MTVEQLRESVDQLNARDCDSTRKIKIELAPKRDGKYWIDALLLEYFTATNTPPHEREIPVLRLAFHDIHRIVQGLAACEDFAYPPPAKGRIRLIEFLRECVRNPDFDDIARKFKIPQRDHGRIVRTNGAAVSSDRLTDAALDHEILERDQQSQR